MHSRDHAALELYRMWGGQKGHTEFIGNKHIHSVIRSLIHSTLDISKE